MIEEVELKSEIEKRYAPSAHVPAGGVQVEVDAELEAELAKIPDKLALYEPYNNRECLHCHEGARRYLKGETHSAEPGRMEKMRRNELSCVSKDCHDTVHLTSEVDSIPLWKSEAAK